MRLANYKFLEVNLAKAYAAVTNTTSNISKDNMVTVTVDDKTSATPNSSKIFKHGLGVIPTIWMVLEGNAYIAKGSVTEQEIDVRSVNASEPFVLLIIR